MVKDAGVPEEELVGGWADGSALKSTIILTTISEGASIDGSAHTSIGILTVISGGV